MLPRFYSDECMNNLVWIVKWNVSGLWLMAKFKLVTDCNKSLFLLLLACQLNIFKENVFV